MKPIISLLVLAILLFGYFAFRQKQQINSFQVNSYLTQFQNWKINFGKSYDNQIEQAYRFSVFINNFQKIQIHNARKDITYSAGINQFTDLTQLEFKETYLTFQPQISSLRVDQNIPLDSQISADDNINWVEQGYVTGVKNQGACKAAWAFAVVGPMEALVKWEGKPLITLGVQQLIDCTKSYGNYGCGGGLMDNAYKYIKVKGITTDDKYPFKGIDQSCIIAQGQYKIQGFLDIADCKNLASELMKIPISVGIDATGFANYKGGVFNSCADKPSLNHAFTLVGMTSEYWLGKMQWGVSWGQNGYIRIARGGSACGICTLASRPF